MEIADARRTDASSLTDADPAPTDPASLEAEIADVRAIVRLNLPDVDPVSAVVDEHASLVPSDVGSERGLNCCSYELSEYVIIRFTMKMLQYESSKFHTLDVF